MQHVTMQGYMRQPGKQICVLDQEAMFFHLYSTSHYSTTIGQKEFNFIDP